MNRLLYYFKNLRFKQKLFISYLVVCIFPVMVLGFFSYYQASKFLLQQSRQNLDSSINQIVGNINFRCQQYEAITNSITQNIVFKQIFNNNYDNFNTLYRDYVDPFFSNILTFNTDILQISVFTENADIQRGEYILPIKLIDGLNWTQNYSNSMETKWHIKNNKIICTREFSSNEEVKENNLPAVLYISIDDEKLFQGINEISNEIHEVLILDKQGNLIFSNYKGMNINENFIRSQNLSDNSGYITDKNISYLYFKKDIPQAGWKLYYFTPKSSLSYDARSIVKATILIVFVCLIILIFVIRIFSNTFVKRIVKLNKKMLIVENGNLKIDVSSNSKDEIGELTNRFGKMLNNINILIEEVYQSKINQKEAELRALQTQINPHFLYNTLSIINWKALQIDADEISQIVTTVSKFYRTVLNKGKNIILVKNEIENAKAYMQIQLIMHSDNFDFICEIDEGLYQYHMINLVFQPILENALEHGIDRLKKEEGRGRITLKGYFSGDNLEFYIEDNGPGMSSEVKREVLEVSSNGYGLKNVHDRIQILFGSEYGLRINSELGKGTRIYVTFPKSHDNNLLKEEN